MKNIESEILLLSELKGGWAARSLFDYVTFCFITKSTQNIELIKYVGNKSTGIGAQKVFKNIESIINSELNIHISASYDKDVKHFANLENISKNYPSFELADFWISELSKHLDVKKNNLNNELKQELANDTKIKNLNPLSTLEKVGFNIINSILPLNNNKGIKINLIYTEKAVICWKRWFLSNNLVPIWLEDLSYSYFGYNKWFIFQIIHNGTHLLHLLNYPQAGSLYNPTWLMNMESIAMYVELSFLHQLNDNLYNETLIKNGLNPKLLKSILILGLIERALRIDFDVCVHLHSEESNKWILRAQNHCGINIPIYNFVYEFTGLPGFASSYMFGMDKFIQYTNKADVLSGKSLISFD